MQKELEADVRRRFGVFPNFFHLTSNDPQLTAMLWGFVQFAYLDNPLPGRLKDRLFVYLSRFCEVRYCVARHVGFLVGSQVPRGEYYCAPQTIEAVLPLLRKTLPSGAELSPYLKTCEALSGVADEFESGSAEEDAFFYCAAHLFLQSEDAARSHRALQQALGTSIEQLHLFLAFVRMAHFWTKLHPKIKFDEDVARLLATHETLAELILNDPAAEWDSFSRRISEELSLLHQLRAEQRKLSGALEHLTVEHESIAHRLRDTESHLVELMAVLPAAMYACNSDGEITYYNDQAVRLWGSSPKPGDPPWSFLEGRRLYSSDGRPIVSVPMREAIETGAPVLNRELRLVRPDGATVNLLLNITPLRNFSGAPMGAVAIVQDITELKKVQSERESLLQELQRSNQELSVFSYSVAHDLQAPVRNVLTLAQILAQTDLAPQEATQAAGFIEKAAVQMSATIDSLLQYAQTGQGQLNRQAVPLASILENVRETLQEPLASSGARLVYGPLPTIDGDPAFIQRLFQNLIANAIQYRRAEAPPVIEIAAKATSEGWELSVTDNGQGIPIEHQSVIFEPLKRLHGRDIPGSGLGLSLCRNIVTRHGGRIWVESEGLGKGTSVRFTLPRSA